MSVGLLLITHNRIGAELLETATRMLGRCPLPATALEVTEQDDPNDLGQQARRCVERLDEGAGVLVLTDLYGSTPANVATALGRQCDVCVLSGVNLPMLVRVLNYPALDLAEIADKALSGAHAGVLACASAPAATAGDTGGTDARDGDAPDADFRNTAKP
jgi:PTS system ascorbate-specific IIA component